MPYGLIILCGTIALAVWFVAATDASHWSKAVVLLLLLASFGWRYGFFLRAGLAVCLALYLTCLKARSEGR